MKDKLKKEKIDYMDIDFKIIILHAQSLNLAKRENVTFKIREEVDKKVMKLSAHYKEDTSKIKSYFY